MPVKINKILNPGWLEPRLFVVLMLITAVMNTSCTSVGPGKLVSSHTAYNESVQLTVTREVLTNIVRSRYLDPMQFITVSAINAQFSVDIGGSGRVTGIGEAGAASQLGGSIGYSDSPTITFVPQSDNAFYNSLISSFSVGEAIAFGQAYRSVFSHADWQTLRFGFSFASINGADDFSAGEYNKQYKQRIDALVQLLHLGARFQQVAEWDFEVSKIASEKVTAEDKVEAFKEGIYFVEQDGGRNMRMAKRRLVVGLVLPEPEDPQVVKALESLGVKPGRRRYIFRSPKVYMPDMDDPYAIWVTPRSVADILVFAGHFVEVPTEHTGIVPPIGKTVIESSIVSQVRIHSSKEMPAFPYRVQHRGYWFYVDDTDINSRFFLEAVVAAYSSRVGLKKAGEGAPEVVIPVGGG